MSEMFILDADELVKLTGKKQKAEQVKALKAMGVPHRLRLDGVPVVTREAVIEYCGGSTKPAEKFRINLDAINGSKKAS